MKKLQDSALTPGDVAVWDLPTRIFHWLLVLLLVLLWYTGEVGGLSLNFEAPMIGTLFVGNLDVHMLLGQCVLALVIFRILWGFVGSSTARFSTFVRGPVPVGSYLRAVARGEMPLFTGHNPAGAWMILLLLTLLALQAGLGLFANDDIFSEGPLAHLVSKETGDRLTDLHGLSFNALLAAAALHVAAALYYLVRGENLVYPMITGRKPSMMVKTGGAPRIVPSWHALPVLLAAASIVWAVVNIG
jgi:cytochrome b